METEGAIGAAVQPPVENTAGAQTAPEPTPKEPSKFRRVLNFLSGKNHEHPAQLHEELQAKKDGASQPEPAAPGATPMPDTSPDIVPGIAAPTAATSSSESAPNSPDLAPIGSTNGAQPTESQTPTGSVDAMINKLQENVEKDSTEDEATQQPASEPTRPAAAQDTRAALDAMTANLAKIPDTQSDTTAAPEEDALDDTPAASVQTPAAPHAAIPSTGTPITSTAETPVGIKNAAVTATVPSEAPSNVVNFQDAAVKTQGAGEQSVTNSANSSPTSTEQSVPPAEDTAPTTPLPKAA